MSNLKSFTEKLRKATWNWPTRAKSSVLLTALRETRVTNEGQQGTVPPIGLMMYHRFLSNRKFTNAENASDASAKRMIVSPYSTKRSIWMQLAKQFCRFNAEAWRNWILSAISQSITNAASSIFITSNGKPYLPCFKIGSPTIFCKPLARTTLVSSATRYFRLFAFAQWFQSVYLLWSASSCFQSCPSSCFARRRTWIVYTIQIICTSQGDKVPGRPSIPDRLVHTY